MSVIDTSALISMKRSRVDEQARWFPMMRSWVLQGQLAFPRVVRDELAYGPHPDAPAVWTHEMLPRVRYPVEPDRVVLAGVLQIVPDLVDPGKGAPDADPYVVAMAWQLKLVGVDVRVVTDDYVDRMPRRMAMTTACATLGLTTCSWADFWPSLENTA